MMAAARRIVVLFLMVKISLWLPLDGGGTVSA
jgi:hypothetical protein